jgi:DNA-binding ferritin-like protein
MASTTSIATHQFSTHIDLPMESRDELITLLNEHLADTFDLMSQTKQAHWNLKGKDFYQLHLLFDEIAGELADFVDLLAERATSLGGYATGTVRMAAENSGLPEYPTDITEGMDHVKAWSSGSAFTLRGSASRSMRQSTWETSRPAISTSRSRGPSISGSGSSKLIFSAPFDGSHELECMVTARVAPLAHPKLGGWTCHREHAHESFNRLDGR